MSDSVLESPSRVIIAVPVRQLAHGLDLRGDGLPLLILPLEQKVQDGRDDNVRQQIAQRKAVAHKVPRAVVGAVQLRAEHSTQVSNRDLHGVGHGALRLARDVDGRPREGERRRRVDATGCEKGAHVRDSWATGWVAVGEQDDVADGSKGGRSGDKRSALVQALGEGGNGQCREEGEGVWRNGEQLGIGSCVAQGFDDTWLDSRSVGSSRRKKATSWKLTRNRE